MTERPERTDDARRGGGDPDTPPGWDYNPARWSQRLPIVGAALVGFVIAGYLALFQLEQRYGVGGVHTVWEPFFGDGSRRILTSPLSHAVPLSDATFGALGYLADAVAGLIGGRRRWRTMPWIVILFGILVGPLGAISIGLVIAQPVLYSTFCTLCLVTAVISVSMIGPALDEVLASLQHLRRVYDRDRSSLWPAFWGRDVARDSFSSGAVGAPA